MPHVVLKLASGRSEQTKLRIAEAIARAIVETADCGEAAVSVAIEDIPSKDWAEKVDKPEILPMLDRLYKKPGYNPL